MGGLAGRPQLCLYAEQQGNLHDAPIAEIASEGSDIRIRMTEPFSALPAYLGFCRILQLQTDTDPC